MAEKATSGVVQSADRRFGAKRVSEESRPALNVVANTRDGSKGKHMLNTDRTDNAIFFNDGLNCSAVLQGSRAGKTGDYIPPFAFNDEQLRHVLCSRAYRYVHHSQPVPMTWDYVAVNEEATVMALAGHEIEAGAPEVQHDIQDRHIAAIKRAGGYLELQAAIAWRSWREGMPSPAVAESLGVSPWMVRQALRRLRAIASKLGYEVGRRHHSFSESAYDRPVSLCVLERRKKK
jgi:hypothetical protein